MSDTKEVRHMALAFALAGFLCLALWVLLLHAGGLVVWLAGPVLLASAEQFLLLSTYALVWRDTQFAFRHKERAIAAMAVVVGVWLAFARAPLFSLLIVPSCSAIINRLAARLCREGDECVSLTADVLATSVGEMAGYILARSALNGLG